MPGPTPTGNILILDGHGSMDPETTFNFQRADADKVNFYAWVRQGVAINTVQADHVADEALEHGTINNSYSSVNSSRIGGTPLHEYELYHGAAVNVPIPGAYHTTAIPALHATVRHNAPTIAASDRMVLTVDAGHGPLRLSAILADPNFAHRSMDVLWDVCKVEAAV